MSPTSVATLNAQAGTAARQLAARTGAATRQRSPTAAFLLLASLTVSFLAGSSAPTPLYPVYMAQWGLSPLTITLIFGIYALAVLLALLTAGRLSDHLGRKPVLLAATLAQAATMLLFATATSAAGLLLARVVQGVTTGAALGAIGAALIDLSKAKGAVANAVAPPFGTATGAVIGGVLVQYLPLPMHLVYAVFGVLFLLQAVGLTYFAESVSPRSGVLASLKPQLKLPAATRGPLLLAAPALVAVWSLAGFYGSLGPMLVGSMLGSSTPLLGGLALFVLAASGGIAIVLLQHREPKELMKLGVATLLVGVGIAVATLPYKSIGLFFLGTAIAGVGFGAAFQGAVRIVVPSAAPHERAGVLSIVFTICYIAMGAPAVVAGWAIAEHYGNLIEAARAFGVVVMVLAGLALLGQASRDFATK